MSAACPDDALLRARRGDLSVEELRALEAHVRACASCRMWAALGRAVGPLPDTDDGDEAMARRLVARQLDSLRAAAPMPRVLRLSLPGRGWRGGRILALAASLVLVASVASAAYWTVHLKAARRAALERVAARPAATSPVRPVPLPAPVASPVADTGTPAPPAPEEASGPPAAVVRAVPRPAQTAILDPETLLRDANEARRARRIEDAIRAYRALQTRFPSSKEAVLSRLSLGNLYLAEGAFVEALAQFQSYLRSDGELAEEALLGEARALAALRRSDDERAVWRTLEARFPESEYLWRARQRLRELDQGGKP